MESETILTRFITSSCLIQLPSVDHVFMASLLLFLPKDPRPQRGQGRTPPFVRNACTDNIHELREAHTVGWNTLTPGVTHRCLIPFRVCFTTRVLEKLASQCCEACLILAVLQTVLEKLASHLLCCTLFFVKTTHERCLAPSC